MYWNKKIYPPTQKPPSLTGNEYGFCFGEMLPLVLLRRTTDPSPEPERGRRRVSKVPPGLARQAPLPLNEFLNVGGWKGRI